MQRENLVVIHAAAGRRHDTRHWDGERRVRRHVCQTEGLGAEKYRKSVFSVFMHLRICLLMYVYVLYVFMNVFTDVHMYVCVYQ